MARLSISTARSTSPCDALGKLGRKPPLTRERCYEALRHEDVLLGVSEHESDRYAKLVFAYFLAEIDRSERLEVLPHVVETLAELKRRNYLTGVITSRPGDPRRLTGKLAMVGLAAYIDQVLTQTSRSLSALDKTMSLRQAAIRASVLPRACMYVGDEPRDMMAAANAGYGAAVAVATGPASYHYLCSHPRFHPDYVMHSIGELPDLLERFSCDGTV